MHFICKRVAIAIRFLFHALHRFICILYSVCVFFWHFYITQSISEFQFVQIHIEIHSGTFCYFLFFVVGCKFLVCVEQCAQWALNTQGMVFVSPSNNETWLLWLSYWYTQSLIHLPTQPKMTKIFDFVAIRLEYQWNVLIRLQILLQSRKRCADGFFVSSFAFTKKKPHEYVNDFKRDWKQKFSIKSSLVYYPISPSYQLYTKKKSNYSRKCKQSIECNISF